MFESLAQLAERMRKVEKTNKKFRKLVGDHYAELRLSASDGIRTIASSSGHFDMHPSESFDAQACTRVHGVLPL
jgi:hypothetical protein